MEYNLEQDLCSYVYFLELTSLKICLLYFRIQDYKMEKIHIDFIYGRVIKKGRIGRCGQINRGRAGVWGRSPRQAESLAPLRVGSLRSLVSLGSLRMVKISRRMYATSLTGILILTHTQNFESFCNQEALHFLSAVMQLSEAFNEALIYRWKAKEYPSLNFSRR